MTPATRPLTLEEYLSLDAEAWVALGLPEGRCEFVDGALVELSPESDRNDRIALNLRDQLLGRVSNDWLIRVHSCEVVVPKLRPKDPSTRFPDLVILQEEHLPIVERRLAVPLDTVPPQLIAEVVSPGVENEARDFKSKRAQYAARGIPEYWLLEPHNRQIQVLALRGQAYVEAGIYRGSDRIESSIFRNLPLTAEQMLNFVTSRLSQEIERAEAERRRAEAERQRAEQAEQRAAQVESQLEAERQRAEAERQRAEQLAERLRQLGDDPDRL
jgi:Uma2 family endonuclease